MFYWQGSGWAGIYLVPKNASKKPHEAFTIVHVPNKDIDEMKALAQSTKHALGNRQNITRFGIEKQT